MSLKDALRAMWTAQELDREDSQLFQKTTCQCCGFQRHQSTDPECVCDGLDWHMLPGGSVECAAHKLMRAVGDGKKTFLMGKK